MHKKLIALAVAGLAAAPAFAQTNVQIYGVADGTMEYVDAEGAASTINPVTGATLIDGSRLDIQARSRFSSNSSLLGFRGSEDLGNGVKAIFQFETGISLDTGMGTSFAARDTFVGLTSGWGTLVGGNLTHPLRNMGTKVSMSPGATGIGFTGATFGTVLGLKTGTDDRQPNSVAYTSPNLFNGLTFTGVYIAGENARDQNTLRADNPAPGKSIDAYQWQVAVQYENGPLYLGAGYHQAEDPQILSQLASRAGVIGTTGAFSDKLEAWRIAGAYKFAFGTKISALWDNQTYKWDATGTLASPNAEAERDAWLLGISQDFGPHTIYGEYSEAQKAKVSGADLPDTKIQQYTVGYNYNFSKRTMLKAYYSEISQDNNSAADFYINPIGNATQDIARGADPRGFGVGLRHVF